jgi:hypothetical protein
MHPPEQGRSEPLANSINCPRHIARILHHRLVRVFVLINWYQRADDDVLQYSASRMAVNECQREN